VTGLVSTPGATWLACLVRHSCAPLLVASLRIVAVATHIRSLGAGSDNPRAPLAARLLAGLTAVSATGPFAIGDRVQLTDAKGRHYTMLLSPRQRVSHPPRRDPRTTPVIGLPGRQRGQVRQPVTSFLVLRPLLVDYVLSIAARRSGGLPERRRAESCTKATSFPGGRVLEAGCRVRSTDLFAAARPSDRTDR